MSDEEGPFGSEANRRSLELIQEGWRELEDPHGASQEDQGPRWWMDPGAAAQSELRGLSHAEAMALEITPVRQLVDGVVEAGTVGNIVGVPEVGKSWLALEVGYKVAAGGRVAALGEVLHSGPVGYFWQDDSEHNELSRLRAYARRHDYPTNLPLRWYLNEGLHLPGRIGELRAEIQRWGMVLVILDSFYNFVPGIELKAESAAGVVTALKSEVCDRTGCAVCVVDHAPWPTEGNRGQRRGYGSVFKGAAIRWGIYLERSSDGSVWLEARGNNVRGLKRTLVRLDPEALELRPIEVQRVDLTALEEEVVGWVSEHPGRATKDVEEGLGRSHESVRKALKAGATSGRVLLVTKDVARALGRDPRGKYWYPAGHKDLTSPGDIQATLGEMSPRETKDAISPNSPTPRRGGEVAGEIRSPAPNRARDTLLAAVAEELDGELAEPS